MRPPKQIDSIAYDQDTAATPNQLWHILKRAPQLKDELLTKREASLILYALTGVPLIKE